MTNENRASEPVLEPALPIIDAHHHLFHNAFGRYLFDEFLADVSSGHNIRATIFVECGTMYRQDAPEPARPIGEVEFANGVAAMSASGNYGEARICAGIISHVDLRIGDGAAALLEAEIAAGGGRVRGVRQSVAFDPNYHYGWKFRKPRPPGLLLDAGFRRGFARLAPLGLSYDCWLFQPQLPELTDLARAFEGTTIILNHLGSPLGAEYYAGKRPELFPQWRADLQALSHCPNVMVKLGGLGMTSCGFGFDERSTPPLSDELAGAWRPYIETAIEFFGPERCMFESNYPSDRPSCTYAGLWNAFKRIASGCSAGEKAALFSNTAARIYRLALD